MKNRLCAWFLVVCLLLGVMPPGAWAADVIQPDAAMSEDNDASGSTATLQSLYGVVTGESINSKPISGGNTVSGEFRHNTDTNNAQRTTVQTLDSAKQGESGSLTWVLGTDGVLTIFGNGPMADYSSESPAPWNADRESVGQVVIESGVTSIGNDAFTDCTAMSSVSIPDTVISIGKFAFLNCYSLENVSIPQNATKIGEQAFYYCGTLSSVTIPASVAEIGDGAFSGCTNLSGIAVASGNSAYVSDNGVLFNSAKTRLINYPAGKSDTAYSIPDSVTEIGFGAFEACGNLTSVTVTVQP